MNGKGYVILPRPGGGWDVLPMGGAYDHLDPGPILGQILGAIMLYLEALVVVALFRIHEQLYAISPFVLAFAGLALIVSMGYGLSLIFVWGRAE